MHRSFFEQRVLNKRIKCSKNIVFIFSEKFGQLSHVVNEKSISFKCAQGRFKVLSNSEGNSFRHRQIFALFENAVEIYMQNTALFKEEEDIITMSISETNIETEEGPDCH